MDLQGKDCEFECWRCGSTGLRIGAKVDAQVYVTDSRASDQRIELSETSWSIDPEGQTLCLHCFAKGDTSAFAKVRSPR